MAEKHCNILVNTYNLLSADLTFNCSAASERHDRRANHYLHLTFDFLKHLLLPMSLYLARKICLIQYTIYNIYVYVDDAFTYVLLSGGNIYPCIYPPFKLSLDKYYLHYIYLKTINL